jgi:hypothetical protein
LSCGCGCRIGLGRIGCRTDHVWRSLLPHRFHRLGREKLQSLLNWNTLDAKVKP